VIPFVGIDETKTAPFHPFGVCVAIAFFVVDWAIMKVAVRRGFERADFRVLTVWLFVLGWFFAWAIDAVFYHPGAPFTLQSLSSTGAIVGATLGAIAWTRFYIRKEELRLPRAPALGGSQSEATNKRAGRWRVSRREKPIALLPVSEVVVATWPAAWAIGRVGCALVHDHMGKAVSPGTLGSLLAVGFPRTAEDGVHHAFGPVHIVTGASDLRFDLGLLELFILAPLAIGFALTWKKQLAMGTYTMIGALVYGPFRFFLDFLRPVDGPTGETRHGGLTFAQYWSLAVIALGIALLVRRRRATSNDAANAAVPTAD
jgi:phosphatidylglycerol:prolipoprotein diacylglycerol transferase